MLDAFVKTYGDRRYRFPVLLNHAGTVLAFAMDDRRRIFYTVLDMADATSSMDVDAWMLNPALLPFASELSAVGFAAADQAALPQVRTGTTRPSRCCSRAIWTTRPPSRRPAKRREPWWNICAAHCSRPTSCGR